MTIMMSYITLSTKRILPLEPAWMFKVACSA